MLILQLQFSRIEFCFRLSCHLCALFALTLSDLYLAAHLLFGLGILASMIDLLQELGQGHHRRIHSIALSSQYNEVCYADRILEVDQPLVTFFSEFLIVLKFPSVEDSGKWPRRQIRVVLLPDMLSEVEHRRLRRYLRFDCQRTNNIN